MSNTPRTDVAEHNMGSIVEPHYVVDIAFARQLERELAEAQAEITRLKGEVKSWAKVFDRTCEHLADAKTELAEAMKEGK
jgi:Skp family chaperone for outer membrane proteins